MERVIKKDKYGNIACNNKIIFTYNALHIGNDIRYFLNDDWKLIKPKYHRYTEDNTVLEIWHDNKGMILSGNIRGFIASAWTNEKRVEITYKEAMQILSRKGKIDRRKDLMSRIEDELKCEAGRCEEITNVETAIDPYSKNYYDSENDNCIRGTKEQSKQKDYILEDDKQNNNGGATDYYSLPKDANTLQDLIEYRNMNGSIKDIFKACYRLGIKTEDELRDANKMAYYSLREVGRITGRKDYITIAKELMGSQAIEKE